MSDLQLLAVQLFNGSLTTIMAESGDAVLRDRLDLFFQFYLPTIKFNQLRFFMDITGFQFFPVDKVTFLTITSFAASVASAFPDISSTVVLYDGRLIWTGLDRANTRTLYNLQQEDFRSFYNYFVVNERHDPRSPSAKSVPNEEARTDGYGSPIDSRPIALIDVFMV
jgi:hypothetical protein